MYAFLLREQARTFPHLLSSLTYVRSMGGGPRTFPGGLNKWQWKRLHEKKAREKEKRLLDHEKQVYQARIRSQIRSNLTEKSESNPRSESNYSPRSAEDHIRVLADRFMRAGAEDLWNEADGPVKSLPVRSPQGTNNRQIRRPIDIRKLVTADNGNEDTMISKDLNKPRRYSVSNSMSLSDRIKPRPHSDYDRSAKLMSLNKGIKTRYYSDFTKSRMRSRFIGSDESSDEDFNEGEEEEGQRMSSERRFASSAALGKYDTKKTRRVPLKFLDEEEDLSEQVGAIRREVRMRTLAENAAEKADEESILSQKRFDECNISPLTVKALTQAGYVQLTRVQEATLSACLEGKDVLVKAKTGTGKSAAFLLPAIETVLKALGSNKNERVPPVYILILCPTRELASQLAAEANVMLKYHDDFGVQTLVGGTRFKVDQKCLDMNPCQIIVATPGRLLDHIESNSRLSVRLMGLKMLIIDEADHLLDLGFRKDVERIVDCLPRQRQSLLFSATIPREVRRISQLVLKREHAYIDTVGLGCVETHGKVKQFSLVMPHGQHFQMVHHLLNEHISKTPDYKVIVFCTTAMVTSLMFLLFREFKLNVREMHSRKPQLYRTRISDEFRESNRLILVTSDVSARGMNYPDVTLVIQVGIPSDREQYIHRLGRTGREGKGGEGILLLAPWEEYFLDEIKDLPIENLPLPRVDPDAKIKMENSMAKIDVSVREAAYHAWLGYYNSIGKIGRDKTTLVELANQFCQSIGLEKPPSLFRKTALKMGLRDIPGIRIRK